MSVHKDELTVALRALQIRRMADTLVERFENEEVDYDWLRPRLQALIEGVEWTGTKTVSPKKRDLAHERYDEVVQFWNDLTKPEPGQPAMLEDWKPFISLPREHGKVLSNRQILKNRNQGWELFYLPGKPFMMFEILDHFVCKKMWKEILLAYPKLSEGPGYWFWAKTSSTAQLGRLSTGRVSAMNILEYMVCFEMIKRSGKCVWDLQTATIVTAGDDRHWVVGSTIASQQIRNLGSILPNVIGADSGYRDVWRLTP